MADFVYVFTQREGYISFSFFVFKTCLIMKGGGNMLKYLSGLFTGALLGTFTYAVLDAYVKSENPEANQKYAEYVKACFH